MSETKRIFSGFIANGYSQGVTIFSQIILVPFFIANWGVQQYGDWLILIALPMYIALSDMGFSTSAANQMCMLAGKKGREREVITTFVSSWYLSILLAAALSVILYAIFIVLQFTGTYKFTSINPADAHTAFLLYVFYTFLTVLCASMASIYKFSQRYALNIYISNTIRLIEAVSTIVLLILKQNMLAVIIGMIVIRILGLVFLALIARKVVPFFTLNASMFSLKKIKELTGSSLNFSLFSTAVNLFPQAFLIALGGTFSAHVVVGYTMVKTLSRFGFQILNSYNNSLAVEISHLSGKKNWEKIFSLIEKSFMYFILFSVAYIVVGLGTVDYIFKLWSHQNFSVDPVLFFLVSATALTQSIWMLFFYVFASSNNHGKASRMYSLVSFLYLMVAFTAMGPNGLYDFLTLGLGVELFMLAVLIADYRKYKAEKQRFPI